MDSQDPRQTRYPRLTRRRFLQATGLTAAGAAIAACTPGASTSAPSVGPASSAAASTLPDLSGQEGVLWGLKYDPHVAAYQRLADAFEAKTGAVLRVEPQGTASADLIPNMIAAIAAGTQPDVYCLLGKTMVPLFIQEALMPLSASVYEAVALDPSEAFIGDAIGPFTWREEIYGVPVETNGVGHIVNVPVEDVEAAGLVDDFPPTNGEIYFESYEQLWDLAGRLQTKSGDQVTRWGLSSKGWELESLLGIIRSQGVKWWDADTKTFNIDSDAGVKALQLLVETPVKMGIETELDQNQVDAALAGKVALARGNGAPTVTGDPLGYNFELSGAPRVVSGEDPLFVGGGGWGFTAPKNAKNPALSLAFLQFMTTQEAQLEFAKIYDGLLNYGWRAFADDTSRFADPSEESKLVRASTWFTALLPQTEFIGYEYGYFNDCKAAAESLCSELRQGKFTAASAAQELQARFVAQHQQYLTDLAAAGG